MVFAQPRGNAVQSVDDALRGADPELAPTCLDVARGHSPPQRSHALGLELFPRQRRIYESCAVRPPEEPITILHHLVVPARLRRGVFALGPVQGEVEPVAQRERCGLRGRHFGYGRRGRLVGKWLPGEQLGLELLHGPLGGFDQCCVEISCPRIAHQ